VLRPPLESAPYISEPRLVTDHGVVCSMILAERKRIKLATIAHRRLQHRLQAA